MHFGNFENYNPMNTKFSYLLRVRYAECDAQKVVFNAKYVEYIDIAITEYFRKVWGDYTNILNQGLDTQVVNVNVSWKASASFDDVLQLTIELKKLGTTSFTYVIEFINQNTGQLLAIGEITYVMVNTSDYHKTAIPESIRHQIVTGATGIVNHAGV